MSISIWEKELLMSTRPRVIKPTEYLVYIYYRLFGEEYADLMEIME